MSKGGMNLWGTYQCGRSQRLSALAVLITQLHNLSHLLTLKHFECHKYPFRVCFHVAFHTAVEVLCVEGIVLCLRPSSLLRWGVLHVLMASLRTLIYVRFFRETLERRRRMASPSRKNTKCHVVKHLPCLCRVSRFPSYTGWLTPLFASTPY